MKLPFEVKQEPDENDDQFCQVQRVNIKSKEFSEKNNSIEEIPLQQFNEPASQEKLFGNTIKEDEREIDIVKQQLHETTTKFQQCVAQLQSLLSSEKMTDRYARENLDLIKQFNDKNEQYENLIATQKADKEKTASNFESLLKTSTERYSKQIEDLQSQLKNQNSLYDELIVAKQKAETDIEKNLKEKYEVNIREIEINLRQKSTQYDELLIAKRAAEENIQKLSSDFESKTKSSTEQHNKEVFNLQSQLKDKNSQYDELLLAMQKSEKQNKNNSSENYGSCENPTQKAESSAKKRLTRKTQVLYEVESLLNHKFENKEHHYLIRWKGYGPDSDSWECERNLSCPKVLEKYKKQHNLV